MTAALAAALFLCAPASAAPAQPPAPPSAAAANGSFLLPSLSTGPVSLPDIMEKFRRLDSLLDSLSAKLEQTLLWKNSGYSQSVEADLNFMKPELFRIDQSTPEAQ